MARTRDEARANSRTSGFFNRLKNSILLFIRPRFGTRQDQGIVCRLCAEVPVLVARAPKEKSISVSQGTFRSEYEYEYEIDYEYDFRISNQSRSQSPRSSLLQTSREGGSWNKIGVRRVHVNPAH